MLAEFVESRDIPNKYRQLLDRHWDRHWDRYLEKLPLVATRGDTDSAFAFLQTPSSTLEPLATAIPTRTVCIPQHRRSLSLDWSL